MKFEVKTHNDDSSKSLYYLCLTFVIFSIIVIFTNTAIKIGKISRYYEINYYCRLLTIEKSSSNFKKLSKLTNQSSKQKIWDLCNQIIK